MSSRAVSRSKLPTIRRQQEGCGPVAREASQEVPGWLGETQQERDQGCLGERCVSSKQTSRHSPDAASETKATFALNDLVKDDGTFSGKVPNPSFQGKLEWSLANEKGRMAVDKNNIPLVLVVPDFLSKTAHVSLTSQ